MSSCSRVGANVSTLSPGASRGEAVTSDGCRWQLSLCCRSVSSAAHVTTGRCINIDAEQAARGAINRTLSQDARSGVAALSLSPSC